MKKILCTLSIVLSAGLYAQVGINTNNPKTTLHVKEDITSTIADGITPPRMTGDEVKLKDNLYTNDQNGTLIYITEPISSTAEGKTSEITSTGYYYYNSSSDGGKWKKISEDQKSSVNFFYMPSIIFNTATKGTGLKRNLYDEYRSQFTNKEFIENTTTGGSIGTNARATFIKSTSAPNEIPFLPNATDLYYYITDYDNTALANLSIDDNGILTYDIIDEGNDYSFVNIVFVIK